MLTAGTPSRDWRNPSTVRGGPILHQAKGGRMKVRFKVPSRRTLAIASSVAVCAALVPVATYAFANTRTPAASAKGGDTVQNYDARSDGPAKKVLAVRSATIAARPTPGIKALRDQLGQQGIVDIDAADQHAAPGGPHRRLPHRRQLGSRRQHRPGLRAVPPGRVRPEPGPGQRPDPAQQLHGHRGHPPPELHPAGRRRHGVRQRPQGPRGQGRPADPGRRLAAAEPAGQRRLAPA